MYGELASWWHLLSPPEDYAGEAARYREILDEACEKPPRTVLELGCGGGNNAHYMKAWYEMTLTGISPAMLDAVEQARQAHVQACFPHGPLTGI